MTEKTQDATPAGRQDDGAAVRPFRNSDLDEINAIYNHYVKTGHAVFDERPRRRDEAEAWMAQYAASGPHRLLVAAEGGEGPVIGWASSQIYRAHPSFRHSVETSIMIAPDARARGLGSRLYAALFDILETEEVHRVYAGVASPNPASCALHEKFGFRKVGEYSEYAIKHGEWISSTWFEKRLDWTP